MEATLAHPLAMWHWKVSTQDTRIHRTGIGNQDRYWGFIGIGNQDRGNQERGSLALGIRTGTRWH